MFIMFCFHFSCLLFQLFRNIESGQTSGTFQATGNLQKAASFVKVYGTYATELFRGAFCKAKSIVSSKFVFSFCSYIKQNLNLS